MAVAGSPSPATAGRSCSPRNHRSVWAAAWADSQDGCRYCYWLDGCCYSYLLAAVEPSQYVVPRRCVHARIHFPWNSWQDWVQTRKRGSLLHLHLSPSCSARPNSGEYCSRTSRPSWSNWHTPASPLHTSPFAPCTANNPCDCASWAPRPLPSLLAACRPDPGMRACIEAASRYLLHISHNSMLKRFAGSLQRNGVIALAGEVGQARWDFADASIRDCNRGAQVWR